MKVITVTDEHGKAVKTNKKDLYFFADHTEFCQTLHSITEQMMNVNADEAKVYKAQKDKVPGYFFCKELQKAGETGHCGSGCAAYAPRNGKSGACKHYTNTFYEPTEQALTIKLTDA